MSDDDTPSVPGPPGDAQIDPEIWRLVQEADEEFQDVLACVVSIETMVEGAVADFVAAAKAAQDVRSPIQKLLESAKLESEVSDEAAAHWNDSKERASVHDDATQAAAETAADRAANPPAPGDPAAALSDAVSAVEELLEKGVAAATAPLPLPAPDADIHVSDSAPLFKNWHLGSDQTSADFNLQLVVPLTDQSIVDAITANQKLMPDCKGSGAGQMSWVKYPPRKTEGWQLLEDVTGDYGSWFGGQVTDRYKSALAAADAVTAPPGAGAEWKGRNYAAARLAAACIATSKQEGLPSSINTYDGLVLSWGIGIAAPGKLAETFAAISKSPRVYKALYLCGFLYQGTVLQNQHHGGYQLVDVAKKQVVFRDNLFHETSGTHRKGDVEGNVFKVLKVLTGQSDGAGKNGPTEMLNLLVQLARDPMTRDVVFVPNYAMIQRMVVIADPGKINSEALYVFAGQVRHNWGLGGDIIAWAIAHLTPAEAMLVPSADGDIALAKAICRRIASLLQVQRWTNAVALLKKDPSKAPIKLTKTKANTEWELDRLKHYVDLLASGKNTPDKSSVSLSGFLDPIPGPVPADHYGTNDLGSGNLYDLGEPSQLDLLFLHDEVELLRFDGANVVARLTWAGAAAAEVTLKQNGTPP